MFSIQNGTSGGLVWRRLDSGVVVGINIHSDDSTSFVAKGGAVFSSYTLERKDEFKNVNTYYVDGSSIFVNFGFIVRL